jgi:hypothetical protein
LRQSEWIVPVPLCHRDQVGTVIFAGS